VPLVAMADVPRGGPMVRLRAAWSDVLGMVGIGGGGTTMIEAAAE
jgi:uncharacterized protein (UPF0261 family)